MAKLKDFYYSLCEHMLCRVDCDGDWEDYCCSDEECRYKNYVKDCDRSWIAMCNYRKYINS